MDILDKQLAPIADAKTVHSADGQYNQSDESDFNLPCSPLGDDAADQQHEERGSNASAQTVVAVEQVYAGSSLRRIGRCINLTGDRICTF